MDITLSSELQAFVAEKIAAGQYDNANDVVRGALEALKAQEDWTDTDIAELREQTSTGVDQLKNGEGRQWDINEIKAEGRSRLAPKK
ncbi:MAG: type II toxin-antitoxin system ParD family antitoxin [Planctomycetota bacterium]